VYGLVLLLLVRFRPQGLWTLPLPFEGLVRRFTGRGAGPEGATATVSSTKLAGSLAPAASADGAVPTPDDHATSAETTSKEVHA
jgi:hypothetical protein